MSDEKNMEQQAQEPLRGVTMAASVCAGADDHSFETELETLMMGLTSHDDVELVSTSLLLAELGADASPAVPRLIAMLENGHGREVKWAAAYALGRIGGPALDAIPALVRALEHLDPDVRDEAAMALDKVVPRDGYVFGPLTDN